MTRTMIYLPEGLHRGLKHLAVERATSLTALIREAVEVFYREDVSYAQARAKRLRHAERTYKRLP